MPPFRETKHRLRGETCVFDCRRLAHDADATVVLFISKRSRRVDSVALPAGTFTFGYFWPQRPYNAYHFMAPAGLTLAHYFNVTDQTHIAPNELSFRDLEADVLAAPGQPARVLDLSKIPADVDPGLRATIDATCAALVADAAVITAEIEDASDCHFRHAFDRARVRA